MRENTFRPDFEKYWGMYILALFPAAAAAYGWRTVALCAVAAAAGLLAAVIGGRLRGSFAPVRGCLIWAMLPLALPPAIPWWVPAAAAVFGETVTRQLFGGYGRNLVNPIAAAVVFAGTGYPGIFEHAAMMPGGAAAGLSGWTSFGPACPLSTGAFSLSHVFLAERPVFPGEASVLVALCGLLLLSRARALDGRWPAGALTGLAAAAVVVGLRNDAGHAAMGLLHGTGFLPALAAAGLDVYSLPRTPEMRLPAGILFVILYMLLRPAGNVVPPAFAALLLTNVLTPLGDTVVFSRRARRWASGERMTA